MKNLNLNTLAFTSVSIFFLVSSVSSCTKRSSSSYINIRIQNNSTLHIDQLWLGSATQNTAYGEIPSNSITDYRQIGTSFDSYDGMNFTSNGVRYLSNIFTEQRRKVREFGLSRGEYYTFTYDVIDENVELTITHDENVGEEN